MARSEISKSHESKVVIGPDRVLLSFQMNRTGPIRIWPEKILLDEIEYETYVDMVHISFDWSN